MAETKALRAYYETYDEDGRLLSNHGQVEYRTTMAYIYRYLTSDCQICEIGAGTGRYSVSLAREGYAVTAVDLVPHNLEILRSKLTKELPIETYEGNALDLSFLPDGKFDVTLLLGPMYHLYTEREKLQAMAEALRITKRGGIVMISYCIADATVIDYIFQEGRLQEVLHAQMMDTETFDLFSAPCDLFELVKKSDIDRLNRYLPVERLHYVATDGATNFMRETVDGMDEETFAWFVKYHLSVCEREDLCGASHHTLDILRKVDDTTVAVPTYIDSPREIGNEIRLFMTLPCRFDGFWDTMPQLTDGELSLHVKELRPGDLSRGYVPAYLFAICLGDIVIGQIDLRIGYNKNLYYGGNIGYGIDAPFRGHGYAGRAVKLLYPVARHHEMTRLHISNRRENTASRRVCEKLGAQLLRCVKLPKDNEMRADGHDYENIFTICL